MHSPRTQISSWAMLPAALALVFAITPICYAGSSSSDGSNSSGSSGNVAPGKTLTGKASYYPNRLNGHETASGDRFHQSDHTWPWFQAAACWTPPLLLLPNPIF